MKRPLCAKLTVGDGNGGLSVGFGQGLAEVLPGEVALLNSEYITYTAKPGLATNPHRSSY